MLDQIKRSVKFLIISIHSSATETKGFYRIHCFDLTLLMLHVQGKLTAQGKLLQQDTFFVTEQDSGVLSRSKERRVFLFEQIVIFSELLRKGSSTPGYQFKKSIKVKNGENLKSCLQQICGCGVIGKSIINMFKRNEKLQRYKPLKLETPSKKNNQ